MRQTTVFITFDDAQHATYQKAIKHLDNKRGDIVLKLAKQVVAVEKYTDAIKWVEEADLFFRHMARIDADRAVIRDDDE